MPTPTSSHKPISRERAATYSDDTVDPRWRGLYRAGGAAALVMVALILIQVVVYVAWPPPAFDGPVLPWFELLQDNRLLGLLSLDLLYLIDSALLVVMYLALYVALRKTSESAMLIGTVLGLVGVAAYYASNTAFEMLYLSNQYADAATDAQRVLFLAAGETVIATFHGTAFHAGINLFSVYFLIVPLVMLRSNNFGRTIAYAGIAAAILNWGLYVPGEIGFFLFTLSILPLLVWNVLVARRLFRLGGTSRRRDLR